MTQSTSLSFEEIASSGGHKDATFHVGGHGEPGPDVKVIVMTTGGETYVCLRRDGAESVRKVSGQRAGLEMFAAELSAVLDERPAGS